MSEREEVCFVDMVKRLGCGRKEIFEAMAFCIEHSECSTQVIQIIEKYASGVPGLYLISDVLFNCNKVDVQYSWSYLPQIENLLPGFMEKVAGDERALNVIRVWMTWGIFDHKYLSGLKSVVDGRDLEISRFGITYKAVLAACDDYFVKKLAKEFGQFALGDKNDQVQRITKFICYLLKSNSVCDEWIFIDLITGGEPADQVIAKVHKSIDLITSADLRGHDIETPSLKTLKKLISKYPSTYLCSHS